MTNYSAFHWSEKARKYAETVGTIFNVKGRVNTVADLPSTGNKVGDLYLVGLPTDSDLIEYAWLSFDNVTRWEKLGSTATSTAFSALTGSPYDNTALKNALDDKQDELPTQTGNNGKFLTTNGSALSWATVDALPSQTSQSGKFLTTNGTTASWDNIPEELPSQSGQSGKYLTTNGSAASWADAPTELPSQSGNAGKFLTTNGSAASWANIPSDSSKADKDLSNIDNAGNVASSALNTAGIRTVVETYNNGTSWYRIWSDGWCEQGEYVSQSAPDWTMVNLLKPYTGAYRVLATQNFSNVASFANSAIGINILSGSSFQISCYGATGFMSWYACGY